MDTRRCNSESCQIAAARTARFDVPVATVLIDPQSEWLRMAYGGVRVARNIEVDWNEFSKDKFLFSHCFVPGTMILMADGTEKPIEMVEEGELVISHTGSVRKVNAVMNRWVEEELTVVKSASLPATASTGEHPYLVLRKNQSWCRHKKGWNKCVYGHAGRCQRWKCGGNDGQMDFVRADEMGVGDRTFTPTMNEVRDSGFTVGQMRLLGYYVSEGGLAKDGREGESDYARFHISRSEMDTLGMEICSLMESCFGVSSHGEFGDPNEGGITLSFSSNEAYRWFDYHAGHMAPKKRLSSEVMFALPSLQSEMMATWIAGDGHADMCKRSVRLSSASPFLASQAEVIFSRIGGLANIYAGMNPGGPTGRDKRFPIFQVSAKAEDLGSLKWQYVFPAYSRWPRTGQRYRHAACSVSEVTRLEKRSYKGLVHNLSVDVDESYVANRMAVHNCTIVSSVGIETDDSKPGAGYYIDPVCSGLVNNNGNAWSNPVLLATFRTFVGAYNYLEHVQIPELSKGRILDAVIRPVVYKNQDGKTANVDYVDILVATSRKHDGLVRKIASGELNSMSMGCLAHKVQCSRCGVVLTDADPNCAHVESDLLRPFKDENGVTRMTAELCGCCLIGKDGKLARDENGNLVGDPKSLEFIEASWVGRPAFGGAVLNHFLSDIPLAATKVLRMDMPDIEAVANDIFRMRVADAAGMMVLKVARAEIIRRRRIEIAERVAEEWL
jgi:hypothetical protein